MSRVVHFEIQADDMALKGMAWQGYCIDPDGNTFGIHQPEPNAA